MRTIGIIAAFVLLAPVVAVRLIFLIRGRLGWVFYLSNTFSEFFVKKVGWSRTLVEACIAVAGIVLLALSGAGSVWVGGALVALLGLELYVSKCERWLLNASYSPIDPIGLRNTTTERTQGLANGYPTPSTHPELTINLVGPFVSRMPAYDLGTLVVSRRFEVRLIIGNHTIVPTQTGIRVRVGAPVGLQLAGENPESVVLLDRLQVGQLHEIQQIWLVSAERGPGEITLHIEWGHFQRRIIMRFTGCVSPSGASVSGAAITRYPGACRSAFAWRGDMDLYDESTLQSIEGLEVTFGLAARFRMPQTMYLSTRLSLDQKAASEWAGHYGCDRGAARIPTFIEWMRKNVELRHACAYPFTSSKRFLIELGNHGHLHFGTDPAAAAENNWKPKARMGAGVYPWLTVDRSSLGEQRDNALEARRWCERHLGFAPKSWAMPGRANDRYTAAAMEAAGCEVLSDSNVRTKHNVLLQPPPHHPEGSQAVELTKRYPGDPQHIYHVAMNLFWIHRAHRKGIPVVFMCHQHLRQFDDYACTRFTEYTLRYALSRFQGDLHVNTVFGIGKYWREVLSPVTRRVTLRVQGNELHLENQSDADFADVPVDVKLSSGAQHTLLISLPADSKVCVDALTGASGDHCRSADKPHAQPPGLPVRRADSIEDDAAEKTPPALAEVPS